MTEQILLLLGRANLLLAAGVLATLLLRQPVRRAFGARVAYALWTLPLFAAATSLLPEPQSPTLLSPVVLSASGAVAEVMVKDAPWLPAQLLALWAGGALIAFAAMAAHQRRFLSEARAGRAGPAVVGLLSPRIVTPKDFEARFSPEEREVILSHERAHLASGDAAANALAAALLCLCWFNPLIHLGVRIMRIDQELACDAAVLAEAPHRRRLYAEALLKTQLAAHPLPLGCRWPPTTRHPLKERIAMLAAPLPTSARRLAGLALVGLFGLGGAGAAWALQAAPEPPKPDLPLVAAPDWMERPGPADVAHAYPPAALAQRLEGQAVIGCAVSAQGLLVDCEVLREAPAAAGFGEAALRMAGDFRMAPLARDGRPVAGSRVRIPMLFRIPVE